MLHELTHNYRGPHDDKFFKFLEGLTDEYQSWRKKRYLAYSGSGQRLGAGLPRNGRVNVREARVQHQQRVQARNQLLGVGGRLGGSGPARPSPVAIAEVSRFPSCPTPNLKGLTGFRGFQAAERRVRATKGCGGGQEANGQSPAIAAEVERAARASIYIDLTTESDESDSDSDVEVVSGPVKKEQTSSASVSPGNSRSGAPAGSQAMVAESTSPGKKRQRRRRGGGATGDADGDSSESDLEIISEKPAAPSILRRCQGRDGTPIPKNRTASRVAPSSPTEWACSDCTLINEATSTTCAACSASLAPIRPLKASMALLDGDGWVCPNPRFNWMCPDPGYEDDATKCGTINEHGKWMCSNLKCQFVKQDSAKG